MSEEKLMILSMLEKGDISAEEAMKLLSALEESETNVFINNETTKSKYDDDFVQKEKLSEKMDRTFDDLDEKFEKLGKKFEEKGEKFEEWGEKFGDKMSKFGTEVADGATTLAEKIFDKVEKFVDNGSFKNIFGNHKPYEETIEKDITNIENPKIFIEAINGKISTTPWSKESIHIYANCHIKENVDIPEDKLYKIIEEDNKLIFKPTLNNNISIDLEVKLPDKMYEEINLKTTNGKVDIIDLKSNVLECYASNSPIHVTGINAKKIISNTKNGRINICDTECDLVDALTNNASINIEDVKCNEIKAFTKNGRIITTDVECDTIITKTSNSSIKVIDVNTSYLKCSTSNGKIIVDDIKGLELRELDLHTSNASIEATLDHEKNYTLDASTSLGSINIDLPDLVYETNKRKSHGSSKVLAKTDNVESEKGIIKVTAHTSNGSIKIK